MMKEELEYDCRWSRDLDRKFINDYLSVCSTVFKQAFTYEDFKRKFLDNIYGESLLVVAYKNGEPCAARALWRNDINDREAYQPGDTCVIDEYRGKGIFSQMTLKAISMLPKDAIIYNFPNQNSFPGYIKLGWSEFRRYHMRLLISYNNYVNEHPEKMDEAYAKWWIEGKPVKYIKWRGHYFLICKERRVLCYRILGEVDKKVAVNFPRCLIGMFFYKSEKITWYNKHFATGHVVTRNNDRKYIPTWKIDAI